MVQVHIYGFIQTDCTSVTKGSKVSSSAEHGKPISKFSSTVGWRIPNTPITLSSTEEPASVDLISLATFDNFDFDSRSDGAAR